MTSIYTLMFKVLSYLPCLLVIGSIPSCKEHTSKQSLDLGIAQANQRFEEKKENIIYPKSSAVIDVTGAEYGAVPNDGKDDTQAIQTALSRFPNRGKIIYLPNGVYNISDTLHWPRGRRFASDYKRTILQGQSRNGVIIRLNNNSSKFQNPRKPRPVISTGFDPNLDRRSRDFKASLVAQRFGNSVRNLTINIGKNNPGAQGLNFVANNQGAVRSVTIMSEDRKGRTGLELSHGEIGPLLVEDVEIIGFDRGIRTKNGINSITMQNITVKEQNRVGLYNGGQVLSLEGFTSVNSVPAIINGRNPHRGKDPGGTLTLINAKLIGRTRRAKRTSAISSAGFIYARNVTSSGYRDILSSNARQAKKRIKGNKIDEYTTRPVLAKFPSPKKSLQLPIKKFPKIAWDDPDKWVNVEDFGAVGNDGKDDTVSFQAAIDSGATTVIVPRKGIFTINGNLRLRGNLKRFIGSTGGLNGKGEIVADNGKHSTLIVEDFFITHKSKLKWTNVTNRTVVYRSMSDFDLESKGTGDVFIDDVVMGKLRLLNSKQSIWARQLNIEGHSQTNIINNGAKLWILGLKTEGGKTKIDTRSGGSTELLGGLIYAAGRQKPTDPIFRIRNSSASFAGVAEAFFDKDTYKIWVEETRGNKTKKLMRQRIPGRTTTNGQALVLYTGYGG